MPRHDGMGSKGGPPAPRLVVKYSSFHHPKGNIPEYVHGHPFNNAMELLLPIPANSNSKQVLITNTDALGTPRPFFQGFKAPLKSFISPEFLSTYIKNGAEFLALSNATWIDSTDAVAVSPDGKLHLALTKETYETLGLVGITSAFQPKQRHNVTIDLRAKSFVPSRKLHDRVQECLTKRAGSLDFLSLCLKDGKPLEILWPGGLKYQLQKEDRTVEGLRLPVLSGERAEPSDTAQPMDFDWGSPEGTTWDETPVGQVTPQVTGSSIKQHRKKVESVEQRSKGGQGHDRIQGGAEGGDPLTEGTFLLTLYEWIGAVACGLTGIEVGINLEAPSINLQHPSASPDWFGDCHVSTEEGRARVVRWTGLIAPSQVLNCVTFARRLIDEKRVPWAALTVWGFADSPVSWYGAEHGFAHSGENDYTLVMLQDGRYLLYSAAGGHDAMKLG